MDYTKENRALGWEAIPAGCPPRFRAKIVEHRARSVGDFAAADEAVRTYAGRLGEELREQEAHEKARDAAFLAAHRFWDPTRGEYIVVF